MPLDNRELTDAARALIEWANSQELSPSDMERAMLKVQAKIICDRLGIKKGGDSPSSDAWNQDLMRANETLMHEIISRVYAIFGRRP